MSVIIEPYTKARIPDALDFERRLREQEDFWGWAIDEAYQTAVARSFEDPAFAGALSFLAYEGDQVVGRLDASILPSHFDGTRKAYLDWICVLKSSRHQGVAQRLLEALQSVLRELGIHTLIALTAANEEAQRFYKSVPNSQMHDVGIWIDIV